jgi:hypothetical protein
MSVAAYEYEVGQRVEVKEHGQWLPATIQCRFIGPHSGWPIYTIAITVDCYCYGFDLRPLPQDAA